MSQFITWELVALAPCSTCISQNIRLALWDHDRIAMQVTPDYQMIWVDPARDTVRTTFTPQTRLNVLNSRLPMVQEGLRITKHVFTTLQKTTNDQGSNLLIVLIPTKERVYCRNLKDTGGLMPTSFVNLSDTEERTKKDLTLFYLANKIT
jgi:hypothetical protein